MLVNSWNPEFLNHPSHERKNKDNLISLIFYNWNSVKKSKSSSLVGTDWEWGSQDGGEGSSGVIFKVEDSGIVHVSATPLAKVTWFEILTDLTADYWFELHCVNVYDILIYGAIWKKTTQTPKSSVAYLMGFFFFTGKVG